MLVRYYVGFGPVSFPLTKTRNVKLSQTSQVLHKDIHDSSIHFAEILPSHSSRHSLCCNHTVTLIPGHHHPSNSSIIVLTVFTRPQASADAPVCVRAPISSRLKLELRKLARVYESRAPEFLSLQNAAPRCLTSPVGFNRPIISQSLFLNFSCANPATPLAQDHLLGV